MSTSGKVRETETAVRSVGGSEDADSADLPGVTQLMRSVVYRRLPEDVRRRVDEAILLRPPERPTPEAIAEQFKLADRYQVSLHALKYCFTSPDRQVEAN